MTEYESRADIKGPRDTKSYWLQELDLADKAEKDWREAGSKVLDVFSGKTARAFNILYSNTETLEAALYSGTAAPAVARRHRQDNPVHKLAAEGLEKATGFYQDMGDLDSRVAKVIHDALLPGRGVLRVHLDEQTIKLRLHLNPITLSYTGADGQERQPDGQDEQGAFYNDIGDQSVRYEYVDWEDYRVSPARHDGEIRWKAFRHKLTRDQLVEMFGDNGHRVSLDWKPAGTDEDVPEAFKRAEVWEILDGEEKRTVWVSRGYTEVLRTDEDTTQLGGFYNCIELNFMREPGSLTPVPEYRLYQDLAEELETVSARINNLSEALAVKGVYPGELDSGDTGVLKGLVERQGNVLLPMSNWQAFGQGAGGIQWLPLDMIGNALIQLVESREAIKASVYEITGISDIVRGQGDASETATAQRIKGQFASLRLKKRQKAVEIFVRDVYRMTAELIAEHLDMRNLIEMTSLQADIERVASQRVGQVPPQMAQIALAESAKAVVQEIHDLLRDDKLRGFAVDVETDSTIQIDEVADREAANALTATVLGGLQQLALARAQAPELVPVVGELIMTNVRSHRRARALEATLEDAIEAMQQPQQQQDPMQAQAEQNDKVIQLEARKAEQEGQLGMAKLQQDGQLGLAKLQQDGALKAQKIEQDAALKEKQLEAQSNGG